MKKLLLFAAFTVFTFAALQAQEIRFGAKAGVNIASLGGDLGIAELSSRTSFHIGGLVEFPLSEKFSLQPELMYSSEGFDQWIIFLPSTEVELEYIRVPILAKYYIIKGLSLEAGPNLGFLLSAKNNGEDDKENFKSFDTQLAFGAAYRLDFGLLFSLRYNLGLVNILDQTDTNGDSLKAQSNVFQISAGYTF